MKCKKCGKYIKHVNCHCFTREGADDYERIPIMHPRGSCYYIRVPTYCTMFEFDNYEEFVDHISCPECNQFSFEEGTSINTYEYADVVFGQEEKFTFNGEKERY